MIYKDKLTTEESWEFARKEFEIHKSVSDHPNIVKLYYERETDSTFELYMEFANKSNYLADKILEVSTCLVIPDFSFYHACFYLRRERTR